MVRSPTFHLLEEHDFAEQRLDYLLIKLLNATNQQRLHLRHIYGFKIFVKYYIHNN